MTSPATSSPVEIEFIVGGKGAFGATTAQPVSDVLIDLTEDRRLAAFLSIFLSVLLKVAH